MKVHISTYSGAHRFFTSHLCTFAFRSWENADTKASRFVATTKDFDISFASLPLHLYMSPSYLRTFALSSSQLRIFPFTTSYSCIFNLEEKVQVALSEHRNVSVFTLDCFNNIQINQVLGSEKLNKLYLQYDFSSKAKRQIGTKCPRNSVLFLHLTHLSSVYHKQVPFPMLNWEHWSANLAPSTTT